MEKKPSEIFEGENSSLHKTFMESTTQQPEKEYTDYHKDIKCSCMCHFPEFNCSIHKLEENKEQENWEERFINLFGKNKHFPFQAEYNEVKNFIQSELSKNTQIEHCSEISCPACQTALLDKYKKELIKEIEGKMIDCEETTDEMPIDSGLAADQARNYTLREIINLIKEK